MKPIILTLLLVLPSAPGWTQESEDEDADAPVSLSEEDWANAETETLELDPLEVTGEGWSYEQEVVLRFIRSAYERPRSVKWEDRDLWVCWIQEGTGSHLNYLGCARNGDILAMHPDRGIGQLPTGIAGYGGIQVSSRPVNRWKLERALEALPGSDAMNEEFNLLTITGEKPPRDIPDDDEVGQFINAYRSVNELAAEGADEDAQVGAIRAYGLTLSRYNRIMELLESYGSLKNEIGERLKAPPEQTETPSDS